MALLKAQSNFVGSNQKDYDVKRNRFLSSYDQKTEFVKDGMIYCKKCRTPKLCDMPERKFITRCVCDCEDKAWYEERAKKEREEIYYAFAEKRKAVHSVSKNFQSASFYRLDLRKDEESMETIGRCENFCNGFANRLKDGKGIWLHGGVGIGKTYLAACIFNSLESQHYRCVFTSATTVFSALKGQYGREENSVMQMLEWADVVFIDKIDEAFMIPSESVYASKKLGEIVRERFENNNPTVIIGENTILDFCAKKNISQSNVDIMLVSMVQLRLNGENRRLKKN